MKYRLAIVSYHMHTSELFRDIIWELFGSYLEIGAYCLEDQSLGSGIHADLIVISSFTVFEEVKKVVRNDAEIIVANYTITKDGFEKLKGLEAGTKAMLVNMNAKVCMETIALIFQLGCRDLNLIPVYPGVSEIPDVDLAITPGEGQLAPPNVSKIVDIGGRVLDINTIVDIAVKLNLESALSSAVIKKYFSNIVPMSYGLEKVLGENMSLSSQQNILLDILEQGVIIVDPRGVIFACNRLSEGILGIPKENAVGKNYVKIVPQLKFDLVLDCQEPIRNKLVRINDTDIELSIFPIVNSGVVYGAVALINKFTEVEKKQHLLRAQLLNRGHLARYTFADILGNSNAMVRCRSIAKRMAESDSAVLITSESGTGKELFAQGIHNSSKRREYQFVAVNCAALSESLLESELFGYEGGAFTGAKKEGKLGLFELAHNGTLFLDEIGDMPMVLQARLLRTLQEKTVMRIGGESIISINVRIICATNKNLEEMVQQNKFRNDLYYRIGVLPLSIPPLRERTEDIDTLIDSFKREYNANFKFSYETQNKIRQHSWPGNVRELRNVVEYLSNINKPIIEAEDIPFHHPEGQSRRVDSLKVEKLSEIFRSNTKDAHLHLTVLQLLEYCYLSRTKLGRRSLSNLAADRGVYLSEQEMRSVILKLESYGFVEIKRGRAGTQITDAGIQLLRQTNSEMVSKGF